ncbi:MAG: magnesium transporter [Prolixibacteraceae bacterium]|jgi:magnesium transporter|nr:magnesium transporter [Prolixibacteraceae bacterium]MBT6007489.1 magnesium transporter [Prolixibacteraceae bacterium]MBT6764091.1 magnesium transporter [Prolixibacteraceae bacterium]MBT6997311.1 magnesium transporter [Prolixibacteraceae bacterium]MBT7395670.1 magnesium transporter [Prolixibacteraceae bacterium]
MQFEISKEYIDQLKELVASNNVEGVNTKIETLHPADIAEVIEDLTIEEAKFIYLLLDGEKASDVLVEIPDNDRRRFLKVLPPEFIASKFIEYMDSDDAADVVADLDEELQKEVLNEIEDVEQAGDIVDLLEYEEDSAGGIMAKELVSVNENWTIATCLKEISKQAEEVDEIYYIYVVDDTEKLKGVLSLKKLILNNTNTKISNVYNADVKLVNTDTRQEEVAEIMDKYDLVAIPVVDDIGRLKGRITFDDVIDFVREEAEKDYQMVSGITGDVEPGDKIGELLRARFPWLLIGLLGGILGALVLGSQEDALKNVTELAFFIPLIAAMGGNVGVQSSSIVVQSIASGVKNVETTGKRLLKELLIALSTAAIFAVLIFVYNFLSQGNLDLTFSVSISLFIVILFASFFGTLIPLVLDRFKIDPALATGPFITTMNDVMGLMIYLMIGKMFFGIL